MDSQLTLPGKAESVWIGTTPMTNYPQLKGKLTVDVVIVGGGIAGITAGYFLARQGKKVAIVEATQIATGTSGNTTAKVTSLHGTIYDFLINNFGKDKAQLYADSNQWAISEIENIISTEHIACDFNRDTAATYTNDETKISSIKKEADAAQILDLPASYQENIRSLSFPLKAAVVFDNQAYFHPRKYLLALSQLILGKGSRIFENSRVMSIEEGSPCKIKTDQGEITATDVIVATNYPIYDKIGLFARMNQIRSYAYAVQLQETLPTGMYLGISNKEPSIRPLTDENNEWLIIGDETHVVGEGENATQHFSSLADTINKLFNVKSFDYHWAAQDSSPIDRVPYIGRQNTESGHMYVTTGFDEWGMTKSVVSAKILTDLITGQENPWAAFYNPSRVSLKASLNKIGEMAKHVIKGYSQHATKTLDHDIENLAKGEGKVVTLNGEKVAVYRDNEGELHAVSAVCTHMGCIVDWNSGDMTWDCPCHGSRYSKEGTVIQGPANRNLEAKKIAE